MKIGQAIEQTFEVSHTKPNEEDEVSSIYFTTDDGKVFYDSVVGFIPYDKNHPSVEKWESFIFHWINDSLVSGAEAGMRTLMSLFSKEYSFDGRIYRGLFKSPEEELHQKEFASFSNIEDVGLYFAGKSEVYGFIEKEGKDSYLITLDVEGAFSFDELLLKLQTLGVSRILENKMDDFIWENEKIYPMNQSAIESMTKIG